VRAPSLREPARVPARYALEPWPAADTGVAATAVARHQRTIQFHHSMGAVSSACQCCSSPLKTEAVTTGQTSPEPQKGSARAAKIAPAKIAKSVGQRRAALEVKSGGFSLKNFSATNSAKIDDCYKISSTIIGEGAFGQVRMCTDKQSETKRAVKMIQKSAQGQVAKMMEEIEIISLLDHPNIVRLYESFQDRKTVFLIMELCDGGELFERIIAAGAFTEAVAAKCVKQMFLAINYLHQNLIIHRDLKPENWLVSSKEVVEKATLKLIDFGISKRLKNGEYAKSKTGTPNYIAPEVMNGRYNEKVDIWSTGVITYIILSGLQPFNGKNVDEIMKSVQKARFDLESGVWKKVSINAKGFIKALLQKNPAGRPAAAKVLQHAWFDAVIEETEMDTSWLDVSALRTFSKFNKVKKAALTIVASQLSDKRIDDLKNLFMGLDDNGDGTLSTKELKEGLKAAGVKIPKDLAVVLEEVDTDGSGVLDYTEFLAASMDHKIYSQENIVWAAFRKFDVDGSGSIDKNELLAVLGDDTFKEQLSIGGDQSQIAKLFDEIDVNGDGIIDFEEFFAMVRDHEDIVRETNTEPMTNPVKKSPKGGKRKSSRSPKTSARSPKTSPRSRLEGPAPD